MKSEDIIIKRGVTWKVLGIKFHQNSSWKNQIITLITEGYSTLRTLKKIKCLTPFHVRKMLAESLILLRINYDIVLYINAPAYLMKRLQRLQNVAAGYVLMSFSNEKDVISLNWLPIIELIDFEISILTQKALCDESWPNYLSLNRKKFIRDLRNNDSNMIERYFMKILRKFSTNSH